MLAAPRSPTVGSPRRMPGSVRRTIHVDARSADTPGVALTLEGAARDVATGAAGVTVLDAARLGAGLDAGRALVELDAEPALADPGRLIGARIGSGFRARVADAAGQLVSVLLDDLPVVALIAGYAWLRTATLSGVPGGRLAPGEARARMADVCSGWRSGGTMLSSVDQGHGIPLQDCPAAPDLLGHDPEAWHEHPPLAPGGMRRRRRIDLRLGRDVVDVDAMFRDTYGESDGTESVLHEYTVAAAVDPATMTVVEITAEPRVLPFAECPLASEHVAGLRGCEVATLRDTVPGSLSGISSCTHLNDLLRSLADVPLLVPHLASR